MRKDIKEDQKINSASIKIASNLNKVLLFLFAVSISALALALITEHVFLHKPCTLCEYQRIPFFIVAAVSPLLLLFKSTVVKRSGIIACVLVIFSNFFLASYHAGVEKKIFKFESACTSDKPYDGEKTIEQIIEETINSSPRCDTPSVMFFGISMAMGNAIYCLFACMLSILLYRKVESGVNNRQ